MEQNLTEENQLEQHIKERFQILDLIGKGAYGMVWKVREISSSKIYALKKVN